MLSCGVSPIWSADFTSGPYEYRDFAEAYGQLGRFLDEVYNRKRIHSALGYLTPAEVERQWLREQKVAARQ